MDLRAEGAFYIKYDSERTMEQNAEVNGLLIGLSLVGNRDNLIHLMTTDEEGETEDE